MPKKKAQPENPGRTSVAGATENRPSPQADQFLGPVTPPVSSSRLVHAPPLGDHLGDHTFMRDAERTSASCVRLARPKTMSATCGKRVFRYLLGVKWSQVQILSAPTRDVAISGVGFRREVSTVRTGIISLADALVSASVVLTAAIICAGAAGADPSQQDQFFGAARTRTDSRPSMTVRVVGVVARAHQICGELSGGTPVDTLGLTTRWDRAYGENPRFTTYMPTRVRRTAVRFITASVDVYCPGPSRPASAVRVSH